MKEYKAMASICEGELKCACAKEVCMTCECREHFHCQEATVIVADEATEEINKNQNSKLMIIK